MTPASQWRFCGSCQKTVFDFTNTTDNDIVKHIEKMKGNMFCGQFKEGQLNQWIEKTDIKSSNPSLYKFLIHFIILTAEQNLVAQDLKAKQELVVKISKVDSALMVQTLKTEMPHNSCNGEIVITGKVGNFNDKTKSSKFKLGNVRLFSNYRQPICMVNGLKIKSSDFNNLDIAIFYQ